MSTTEQQQSINSFALDWPYVSEVRRELGADGFDINPTQRNFKSGRPMYEAVFYKGRGTARKVIAKRQTMALKSKTTQKPYYVCRSYDEKAPLDRMTESTMFDHMAAASEDLVSGILDDKENKPPQITILKRQATNGR